MVIPDTRRSRRTTLAASAAFVLVLLGGCSSGGDSDDAASDSSVAGSRAEPNRAANEESGSDAAADLSGASNQAGGQDAAGGQGGPAVEQQRVISTGNVQLRAGDVGQAVFDVRKIVDSFSGTIAEDDTTTDKDGSPLRSRMVLRIPTADFEAAMVGLERIGTLVSSQRESADVTTQVLDIGVRVEAQQRSIDRIQILFDSATSIKDVVSVESELSRRQADLASLQAQQRYLQDQTSMSTITLAVERTGAKADKEPDADDAAGFLTGLSGGWSALKGFLVGLATVAGALLPWLALALVVGLPGWLLLRRLRRREESVTPTAT